MKTSSLTQSDYQERINKVLIYIDQHLEEKLELDRLAEVSNFSPYHFHRIIRAHINEPLGSYITRLKLEKAAGMLRTTDLPLNEIAWKIGYENPSSFNKAFKKRFCVSPSEFKQKEMHIESGQEFKPEEFKRISDLIPKIKTIREMKVIYVRSIGAYGGKEMGEAWETLLDFAKVKRLFGFKFEMLGIGYDNPNITEEEKLRYDACLVVRKDVEPEGKVGVQVIPEGKYAIFRYRGSYAKLRGVYYTIFRYWWPESGCKLRNVPSFEKYLNNPERTKEERLLTEIYIPVE